MYSSVSVVTTSFVCKRQSKVNGTRIICVTRGQAPHRASSKSDGGSSLLRVDSRGGVSAFMSSIDFSWIIAAFFQGFNFLALEVDSKNTLTWRATLAASYGSSGGITVGGLVASSSSS